MRPHLVKEDKPASPARKSELNLENVNRVINGMYAVVNEGGTGVASRIPGVEFSGKTGSAQRVSNDLMKKKDLGADYRDDGWFVGFAPRSQPEIVVAALFEHGVHGDLAAPIVRDVVKAWHDKKIRQERPRIIPSLAKAVALPPTPGSPVQ